MKQFLLFTFLFTIISVNAQDNNSGVPEEDDFLVKQLSYAIMGIENNPWLYGEAPVEYRDWSKVKNLPRYFSASVSYLSSTIEYYNIVPSYLKYYLKKMGYRERRKTSPYELMQYIRSKGDIYFMLLTNQRTNMYDTAEARAYICSPNESHIRVYMVKFFKGQVQVYCIQPAPSEPLKLGDAYLQGNLFHLEYNQQFVINEAYKRDYERYAKDVAQRLAELHFQASRNGYYERKHRKADPYQDSSFSMVCQGQR